MANIEVDLRKMARNHSEKVTLHPSYLIDAAESIEALQATLDKMRAVLREIEMRTSSYRDRHDEWPLAAGINFEARKALGLSH